jgi:DeoR/GlpR family transcriptional regulator of sugar metabolism
MKTETRQVEIYNLIKTRKSIDVVSIAELLGVSAMTIRRDLQCLETSKLIKRSYGKAQIIDGTQGEIAFEQRQNMNIPFKQKIASIAVQLLTEYNIKSIFVDSSSTILEFIKILPPYYELTVFTNSLPAINNLQDKPWIKLFIIGGFYRSETVSFDDLSSTDLCRHIFVDATFTSCSGLTEEGIFNSGANNSEIRRIMQMNSKFNFILADHTKFNHQGIFRLNTWEKIDTLITDEKPADAFIRSLEQQKVQIIWEFKKKI